MLNIEQVVSNLRQGIRRWYNLIAFCLHWRQKVILFSAGFSWCSWHEYYGCKSDKHTHGYIILKTLNSWTFVDSCALQVHYFKYKHEYRSTAAFVPWTSLIAQSYEINLSPYIIVMNYVGNDFLRNIFFISHFCKLIIFMKFRLQAKLLYAFVQNTTC
jgi:hypothetical protein